MYGLFGGCTTLFHLFVRHPILVLALGLSGFAAQVPSNPGPGDRHETDKSLAQLEQSIVREKPELTGRVASLQANFNKLYANIPAGQLEQTSGATDPCTESSLKNPDSRREAAWILYLDAYSRNGPATDSMFFGLPSHSKKE